MSASSISAPHTLPYRDLRVPFILSLLVGVAIVIRRVIALRSPATAGTPMAVQLDAWFRGHATLTYAHILLALCFLVALPLIFWTRTRRATAVRATFYLLGLAVAGTAFGMSTNSVGGWVERSAVFVFNTLFLISLALSFRAWQSGAAGSEQRWTLRAVAVVLGIATTRPVMAIFFATAGRTHLTPEQFFGPAFWIGFSINVIAMELWLRRHARHRPRPYSVAR